MLLLAVMGAASLVVRPDFTRNFFAHPWLSGVPLLTLSAAAAVKYYQRSLDDLRAFLAGAVLITGIVASVAAGLYPTLLPPLPGSPHPGLDIYNATAMPTTRCVDME